MTVAEPEYLITMPTLRNCRKQSLLHRGKTSTHASMLLKFALRTWREVFRRLLKTQTGSQKERLRCFAFSVIMQAE
jgi:hypothetical protein